MSFTNDLLAGVAEALAAAGLGVWRPDGPKYQATETGIATESVPQSPDRVIVLSDYQVWDDETYADSTAGLQVRTRVPGTDARSVKDLDDAIYDRLEGLHDVTLGGVRVQNVHRISGTPLGQDSNGRPERVSNYHIDLYRPAPNRL